MNFRFMVVLIEIICFGLTSVLFLHELRQKGQRWTTLSVFFAYALVIILFTCFI
jgi:hypothetical protein